MRFHGQAAHVAMDGKEPLAGKGVHDHHIGQVAGMNDDLAVGKTALCHFGKQGGGRVDMGIGEDAGAQSHDILGWFVSIMAGYCKRLVR